jgi:hypothetical protein
MVKLTLFLIVVIYSCRNPISQNELKAIDEIANQYGGQCSYSININKSISSGKKITFEVELSNSNFLDEYPELGEMVTSNMAYILFKFPNKERKYDEIISTVVFQNGRKLSVNYLQDKLETVDIKLNYVNKIIDLLHKQEYKKVENLIVPDSRPYQNIHEHLVTADSILGKILDFKFTGFKFKMRSSGIQLIRIYGNLKRTKTDSQFSIEINSDIEKDEVFFIDYIYDNS